MSETRILPIAQVTPAGACCGDDCCGGANAETHAVSAPTTALSPAADPRSIVREKYGVVAEGGNCGCGCCQSAPDDEATLTALGYTTEQQAAIPAGADLGLGCGNPLAHAALQPGETVLDLGSGAGIDCFLAAREVGPSGHVIGVDMTAAMLERARANAARLANAAKVSELDERYENVQFRLGEIEHLPVADASVDAIISNCVVNLSPDKPQVFREALRVLKPGGRLVVSDLVLNRELGEALRRNVDLYVGCVAGASLKDDYLRLIREAGFAAVEVVEERGYSVGIEHLPPGSPEREAFSAVTSVKVRALKAR